MREAMASAEVGDDVYEDDPTVKWLEDLAAELTGKEAGLFVPSGTMGNQLAIMAHTKRGDEIILGQNSHIVAHEVGAAAVLSGVSYRIVNNPDDIITVRDIEKNVREADIHCPDTGLVCVENALANGTVVPLETMAASYAAAKKYNLPVHLDGARLFNAAVYLRVEAAEVAKYCDSVMFCLSKGLCAPVGSMLCGSHEFIAKARKYRKMLGGGMRQVGILAAAGIIALEVMTQRLHIDHKNARYLADELADLPFILLDRNRVHINMVFFTINKPEFDHKGFAQLLLEKKIKINSAENGEYRFVTHNDITRENIDTVVNVLKGLL